MTGIYKITNKVNGKVYIGQAQNIEKRWKEHKNSSKNKKHPDYNKALYGAMRKYGFENFEFEILMLCEKDLLNLMEIYYIEKYNSYIHAENSNGYNVTLGGCATRGFKMPKEAKEKMSVAKKGKYCGSNHHNYGKKMNEEQKRKLSESKKGKPHSGRHVICEDIEFMSISECARYYEEDRDVMKGWLNCKRIMPQKFVDMKLRYADKEFVSKTDNCILKGKEHPSNKPVICNGVEYYSVSELCKEKNLKISTVSCWLTGKYFPSKKYNIFEIRYK